MLVQFKGKINREQITLLIKCEHCSSCEHWDVPEKAFEIAPLFPDSKSTNTVPYTYDIMFELHDILNHRINRRTYWAFRTFIGVYGVYHLNW